MKQPTRPRATDYEYLQIQVPSARNQALAIKAAMTREPIRMVVLLALEAYGVKVSEGANQDRWRRQG
jgi:hypothetical protein